MTNEFRVATTLSGKLAELGVPPADVLRQAELPSGLLEPGQDPGERPSELFALYRGIGQASRDPAIGLKLGTEPRVERYVADGHRRRVGALVSRRPPAAGPLQAARCAPKSMRVSRSGGTKAACSSAGCSRRRPSRRSWWTSASRACVDIARRGTGEPVTPKRVELRGASVNREMYEAHFGCPVKLRQPARTRRVRQGGPRSAVPHVQRGSVRDHRAQLEAELKQSLGFEGDRRAGQDHPEAVPGRPAARARGRRAGASA